TDQEQKMLQNQSTNKQLASITRHAVEFSKNDCSRLLRVSAPLLGLLKLNTLSAPVSNRRFGETESDRKDLLGVVWLLRDRPPQPWPLVSVPPGQRGSTLPDVHSR
ncbi:hypothetical protein, partial [Flexivirga caeni]|uniref:hypothetical protein n=1 Tax=Flexivirga caeni TaxID=2294115 RepID=UPI001C6598CF